MKLHIDGVLLKKKFISKCTSFFFSMNNNLDGCVFYKFDTCYFYPANWILNHKILVKELFKDFADESVVAEQ